jgi:serine protease Do
MSVQDLDAKLAEELGIDPELTGVVVVDVIPGSPAADKGLAPGDIIRRYGQRRVDDALALAKDIKVAENGGKSGILILVERDGRERFVQIGFAEKTE